MTDTAPAAGPGVHRSNLPDLREELIAKHKPLLDRHAQLKEELSAIGDIVTDEDLERARAAVSASTKLLTEVERARTAEKTPYQKAVTDIDGLFNREVRDTLDPVKKAVADRVANFLNQRRIAAEAEAARKAEAAQAEADRLAAEAQRLESEGRHREADTKIQAAVHQEGLASQAEAFIHKPAAEQSRVYTGGGSASVRTKKAIQSIDRATVDLNELRPFFKQEHLEAAIEGFMRTGRTDLKGVVFYDKPIATIR
jgi:hypothetical protein